MPRRATLKVVRRTGSSTLYVRGTVAGVVVFESARTDKPELAEEFRNNLEKRLYKEALHGPPPAIAADKSFADAALSYCEYEARSKNTLAFVKKLVIHFGHATLSQIDQSAVDLACKEILRPGATGATRLRQIVTPVRAILRHAVGRGMMPTMPMIARPKVAKVRRDFLRPGEALKLVHMATPSLRPLIVFALATGARPAEYLDLDWRDVDLRGRRVRFLLKGGATRDCDLCPAAIMALEAIPSRTGSVFRPSKGKARYKDNKRSSGGQFATAWAGACHRAGLPGEVRIYARKDRRKGPSYERFAPEHTPYVLRHTWASWHYAIHKDLVKLEIDGAWEGPAMVRIYAHLMPLIYRQDAIDFLEGRVDFQFSAPGADRRFRAIAVQSGSAPNLGGLKRA